MTESEKTEKEKLKNEEIERFNKVTLEGGEEEEKSDEASEKAIQLLSIIGEVEGHDCLPQTTKTTKYEHVLPLLAEVEDSEKIGGLLLLLNTVGGDVESGLAIAEMVASLGKPTVSLVLGGSHSIGGPLAVSTDYSFIVPTGTMIIHPVRLNGTVIGAPPTYEYFKRMQERITGFMASHSHAKKERLDEMMMNTGMMSKDLGTILVGEEAVKEGLIDEVGGIHKAYDKLKQLMEERK